jgi:hypothetical protein
MKVDNKTNVAFNQKRNTVRISTQDRFAVGSVWIADMLHVPFGVSLSCHLRWSWCCIVMLTPFARTVLPPSASLVLCLARLLVSSLKLARGRRNRHVRGCQHGAQLAELAAH